MGRCIVLEATGLVSSRFCLLLVFKWYPSEGWVSNEFSLDIVLEWG